MHEAAEITSPQTKAALSWGAAGLSSVIGHVANSLGIVSWAEAAQFMAFVSGFLAAILTACYLCEWWWKRMWRPLFVAFGWLMPNPPKDEK